MRKFRSLLKASMSEGMELFRFGKRNKNGKKAEPILPIVLAILIGISIWGYADMLLDTLIPFRAGFVMLTLFVLITAILTFIETIYKAGGLLFNCKDDDLLLSLPVERSTVLFVRIFKLYVFEVLYNALFLAPAMLAYAVRVGVDFSFFVSSVFALLFLPVIPIVLGCVISGVITGASTKFRMKNVVQIIGTTVVLLLVLAVVSNMDAIMTGIAEHADSINNAISTLYYPAGAYAGLVTDFSVVNLLIFTGVNVMIFGAMVVALGKIYYKINSRAKVVKAKISHGEFAFKRRSAMSALVRKELKKFISTPVLAVNAGFGLVLFVAMCVLVSFNLESVAGLMNGYGVELPFDLVGLVKKFAPVILFGLIVMAALMSSITSSMISLEGKKLSFLKSLPVDICTVLRSKVLAAVLVMMPFILVGDLVMFLNFHFSFLQVVLILGLSVVLPVVAESIGIAVNLKYPKLDATSDAEVVKQSTSSLVATLLGMGLTILSAFLMVKAIEAGASVDLVLVSGLVIYGLVFLMTVGYVKKVGQKKFRELTA